MSERIEKSADGQKAALAKIADLLKEADAKLNEATAIADEAGVPFGWNGPEYGMGGFYSPKGWQESQYCSYSDYEDKGGWNSSSSSC